MKDVIYITGHKNPDSDSICSTLAYAEFKNRTQSIPAIPVRLGDINRETKFILEYFDVEPPMFIETLKAQIGDLNIDKIAPISPDISLKMAWNIMKKVGAKTLPVTNEDNTLIGIVSASNLISNFMDIWDNTLLSRSKTRIENIIDTLSASVVYIHGDEPHFTGKIVMTSFKPNSLDETVEKGDIAICGDTPEIQLNAIKSKASLLIVTDNKIITEEVINAAKTEGCTIIATPCDSFTAARLITQSIPVSYVMSTSNILAFNTDDFVDDIKGVMLETRYRSYPVIDKTDNVVVGSVSRYHLISQKKKKIILLDHNEKSQSVHGLEDAEILEIIDHHRVADVQTGNPIYFRNEPVGSTSTIIASIFFENGIRPSRKIAGLLSAAIISDTLLFKSPTSTNIDRIMLKRLAEIAGIDVDKFAKEMFKAGTSLLDKSPEEIFYQDFKVFTIKSLKVGVSQVATLDMESFEPIAESFSKLVEKKASENNFSILVLMLTDILNGSSRLIVAGTEKELAARAFNAKLEGDSIYLPGVISRKKQLIPPLTTAISTLKKA